MAPYERDAEDHGLEPIELYTYNMALASALLGPLNIAETVVRNAIQKALTAHFGQADWWSFPGLGLTDYHANKIEQAQDDLSRRFDRQAGRSRDDVCPGDVVAELEFGFWTGLLGPGPEDYDYERKLWQPALMAAFPHNRRDRKGFKKLLDAVRRLRNRVTHHEPIYRNQDKTEARYDDTLLVIRSVSPPLSDWVRTSGRASTYLPCNPLAHRERATF